MIGTATINTDASFIEAESIGSFAFWIAMDGSRYKSYGMLKGPIIDPTEAELKAICNALHYLKYKTQPLSPLTKVFINTDSNSSIYFIREKKTQSLKGKYADVMPIILELIEGLEIVFKHVPGHKASTNKAGYVNNWCDRQCREAIKEYRQKNETAGINLQ